MWRDEGMTKDGADPALIDSIETFLKPILALLEPEQATGRGRPRIMPALALWAGMLVCVARGYSAQLELWRLLNTTGLWTFPRFGLTDEAVYKRLKQAGTQALQTIFEQVTRVLKGRLGPSATELAGVAEFATGIFALDETTLDAVTKRLPRLREGTGPVLGGKITALFDIRAQLWQRLAYQADPHQNEKVAARSMLAFIPPGSLLLADLGYFAFAWFDELTQLNYHWISRLRANTSYEIIQTLYGPGRVGCHRLAGRLPRRSRGPRRPRRALGQLHPPPPHPHLHHQCPGSAAFVHSPHRRLVCPSLGHRDDVQPRQDPSPLTPAVV